MALVSFIPPSAFYVFGAGAITIGANILINYLGSVIRENHTEEIESRFEQIKANLRLINDSAKDNFNNYTDQKIDEIKQFFKGSDEIINRNKKMILEFHDLKKSTNYLVKKIPKYIEKEVKTAQSQLNKRFSEQRKVSDDKIDVKIDLEIDKTGIKELNNKFKQLDSTIEFIKQTRNELDSLKQLYNNNINILEQKEVKHNVLNKIGNDLIHLTTDLALSSQIGKTKRNKILKKLRQLEHDVRLAGTVEDRKKTRIKRESFKLKNSEYIDNN